MKLPKVVIESMGAEWNPPAMIEDRRVRGKLVDVALFALGGPLGEKEMLACEGLDESRLPAPNWIDNDGSALWLVKVTPPGRR